MRRLAVLILMFILPLPLAAQDPDRTLRPQQAAVVPLVVEARTALVIGNGGYKDAPLKNPPSDARAMAQALTACGFKVSLVVDANRAEMFRAVREFGERIRGGGVGLFYYAGQGMQVRGANYLIPVGVDINSEDEVPVQALDVNAVLGKMDTAKNRVNLLILDACRNNPFVRSFRSASRGLTQMEAPSGSFLAFATAPAAPPAMGMANSGETIHPVGQKQPNAFGLHDMLGNVSEWCQDRYGDYPGGPLTDPQGPSTGQDRVMRGGSWDWEPTMIRSTHRGRGAPDMSRYVGVGFRVVAAVRTP